MSKLEHALALARRGFNIFPLRPGAKTPLFSKETHGGWQEYMTQDETTIRNWFEAHPDMNYAVNPPRGYVVLDPDLDPAKAKDGAKALAELEDQHDIEDAVQGETFTVRSPRGGSHLYLKTDFLIPNNQSLIAPGVDVRGFNGYVVGPGSHTVEDLERNTAEGTYEVIRDGEMKECPKWILDLIAGRDTSKVEDRDEPLFEYDTGNSLERARQWLRQQTEFAVEGHGGNNHTYTVVAFMRDFAVSPESTLELLNEPYDRPEDEAGEEGRSWNGRCSPAWTDAELERIIDHAYKYGQNRPGTKGGLLSTMDTYAWEESQANAVREQKERFSALSDCFFPGGTILDRHDDHDFIAPDWLPDYGLVQMIARRQTGKTITAIDLALRCAGGGTASPKFKLYDWYGTPLADDWAVLYIAGEDDWGVQKQIKAWSKAHGKMPESDRFAVLTKNINLMNGEEIAAAAEFFRAQFNGRRVMVVLDTWQRATSTASQNDDVQMQAAVHNAEMLAKCLRGPLIALVHPPKHNDHTASGSAVTENSTTAIWVISMKADLTTREMKVVRIKNAPDGKHIIFNLKPIDLGTLDRFGRKNEGVIIDCQSSSVLEESAESKGKTANSKAIYATLIGELLQKHLEAVASKEATNSRGTFGLKNTADRILEYFAAPKTRDESSVWKKRLHEQGDKSWESNSTETLRSRLSDLFRDGRAVKCLDDKTWIVLSGAGHASRFVIDEKAALRHETAPEDKDLDDI